MNGWINAAQWIAPIATVIAAMMTAANLGARPTGWGFAVFTLGSVCWTLIGVSTGQSNLLATNAFLTVVNLIGIWRWLGRQARYEDGAQRAASDSENGAGPPLIPVSTICGLNVADNRGESVGRCVEALIDRDNGQIAYIVVASSRTGGMDEELRGVARSSCDFGSDAISLSLDAAMFEGLPVLPDRHWPARL